MQDASFVPEPIPPCPGCAATHVVRNGHNRSGAANFLCRGCGRQFVARPKKEPVPEATQDLIRRLLRERMALRAIARSVGVSRSWLRNSSTNCTARTRRSNRDRSKKSGRSDCRVR